MSRKKDTLPDREQEDRNAEKESDKLQTGETQQADEPSTEEQEEEKQEEKREVEGVWAEASQAPSLSAEEIAKLIEEKEEYFDRLLRSQADFDNYRKRVQKEQVNLIKYGAENALHEILPVVDNIERAVDSARKHDDSNSQLREGVELILTQFLNVLEKLGVKPIETVGHPFDPNKHDALLRVHAPDVSEGAVVDEIRKGYYLYDKVLRPAQVTVGTHEPVQDLEQTSGRSG
ncbi:MAG: nucleotide exchange factor GrpE [Candidatus Hydrogenedentota bacterium]|nr:MAG: nucleotide exchange factor GrpE [Candidatus Hydrogenedentota bacterium]